jgi:hypothetical protein
MHQDIGHIPASYKVAPYFLLEPLLGASLGRGELAWYKPGILDSVTSFVVVCLFFEMGSHYVAQTGLQLKILLPQPTECWD